MRQAALCAITQQGQCSEGQNGLDSARICALSSVLMSHKERSLRGVAVLNRGIARYRSHRTRRVRAHI